MLYVLRCLLLAAEVNNDDAREEWIRLRFYGLEGFDSVCTEYAIFIEWIIAVNRLGGMLN